MSKEISLGCDSEPEPGPQHPELPSERDLTNMTEADLWRIAIVELSPNDFGQRDYFLSLIDEGRLQQAIVEVAREGSRLFAAIDERVLALRYQQREQLIIDEAEEVMAAVRTRTAARGRFGVLAALPVAAALHIGR